jgi:hypothetical protein
MCGENPLLNWIRTFEHCEKPLENNFRDSNEKVQGSIFFVNFFVVGLLYSNIIFVSIFVVFPFH